MKEANPLVPMIIICLTITGALLISATPILMTTEKEPDVVSNDIHLQYQGAIQPTSQFSVIVPNVPVIQTYQIRTEQSW